MNRSFLQASYAELKSSKTLYALLLYFFVLLCYLIFVIKKNPLLLPTDFNYFSHFAYALLNGSIALVAKPDSLIDLTSFGDKLYMYWPPSPVLFVLPFVYIFGITFPDAFYTALIGAANPVLLFFVVQQFSKLIYTSLSKKSAMLFAIFYAFGTTHFYQAVTGTVWFTGQVLTQTYLLLALWSYFSYLKTPRKVLFWCSIILFFLTCLGRNNLLLALPGLFFFGYIRVKKESKSNIILLFFTASALTVTFLFFYNYFRFGSIFENGFRFNMHDSSYIEDITTYGLFSIHYIPHNLYYQLLHPIKLAFNWPFVFQPDYMGNSIFMLSPLFIYLFTYIVHARKLYKMYPFILYFLLACLGTYIPIVLLASTGWMQFGARYLLDITPFLILLLVPLVPNLFRPLPLLLIFLSIYLNLHAFLIF